MANNHFIMEKNNEDNLFFLVWTLLIKLCFFTLRYRSPIFTFYISKKKMLHIFINKIQHITKKTYKLLLKTKISGNYNNFVGVTIEIPFSWLIDCTIQNASFRLNKFYLLIISCLQNKYISKSCVPCIHIYNQIEYKVTFCSFDCSKKVLLHVYPTR